MAAIGDIVLFTLHQGRSHDQERPAVVVRLHEDGHHADLLVLLAGEKDEGFVTTYMPLAPTDPPPYVTLVTAPEGEGAGHWRERGAHQAKEPDEPPTPPEHEPYTPSRGRRR